MILLTYFIKTIACTAIILGFYQLFLEKETNHVFKRLYLISGLVLSVFAPFLPTFWWTTVADPVTTQLLTAVASESNKETLVIENSWFSWEYFAVAAYGGICLLLLIRFVYQIAQLRIKSKKYPSFKYQHSTVVLLSEPTLPYAFLNHLYVNGEDWRNNRLDRELLDHEYAHIRQYHSLDILLIEFIKCLFWINPFLPTFKKSIQLNHEFLADKAVLNKNQKTKKYQNLLLALASNNHSMYLASHINYLLTKKRLEMMNNRHKSPYKMLKFLGVVPLFIFTILLFGAPTSHAQKPAASDRSIEKEKDDFFARTIIQFEQKDGSIISKKYAKLTSKEKAKIVLPPPPPPPPGRESSTIKTSLSPLPENTKVMVYANGNVRIDSAIDMALPPTPPAPPSAPPAPPSPPSTSMVPPPPPPPPPPPTIEELIDDGADFHLDGKKISVEKAKELMDSKLYHIRVQMENGEGKVYLKKKK